MQAIFDMNGVVRAWLDKEYVYNLGSSASVGAKYIIQEIQKAIKRHKEQE